MADLRILHNPRCSKSRQALALLEERDLDVEVVRYLDSPPSEADLRGVVEQLDGDPADLVRRSDPAFRELGLDPSEHTTPDDVVALLVAHPRLLERPVVVRGERAVIGRPPERVLDLL